MFNLSNYNYETRDIPEQWHAFVDGLNKHYGNFNDFGRQVLENNLIPHRLKQYFGLKAEFEKHEDLDFDLPIIQIMSMPRSGSTYLHRCLATSGIFHGPQFFEFQSPLPITTDLNRQKKIDDCKKITDLFQFKSFGGTHTVEAEDYEDDPQALFPPMLADSIHFAFRCRSFTEYCNERYKKDNDALIWQRSFYNLLWRNKKTEYFLCKTPLLTANSVKSYKEVFPNSKIIWITRDEDAQLNSLQNALYNYRGSYTNISEKECLLDAYGINRIARSRYFDIEGSEHIHVTYDELIQNPMRVMAKIFEYCDIDATKYYGKMETGIANLIEIRKAFGAIPQK